jgi:hypothetical protein
MQFGDVLSAPLTFLLNWLRALADDTLDVLFSAWFVPLQRLNLRTTSADWLAGFAIAALALALVVVWIAFSRNQMSGDGQPDSGREWRREVFWLGVGMILFGLLPVILVGRTVDFKSYSRYTLIASIGAGLLWTVGLSAISNLRVRTALLSLLLLSASLTHYANGLAHARDTAAVRNFWWQVSWRIPQLGAGATLVAHYPVIVEEDYFIWGPANLIYHPESAHKDYAQPAIYAALLNEETIASAQAKQPQDFSNRRGIRTYKNYRNILILSQPTPVSCVQVIDGQQVELSSAEISRVADIASFSEPEHILLNEAFHTPPAIPFGGEPPHGWCYFYQKAAYARQLGNWDEVAQLGNEARSLNLSAGDPIEWMPFLQAYSRADDVQRVEEIARLLDAGTKSQACKFLSVESLSPATREQINKILCSANQ